MTTELLALGSHVRVDPAGVGAEVAVRYGKVAGYGTVHDRRDGGARAVYLVALDNGGDLLDGGGWVSLLVCDPGVVELLEGGAPRS